MKKLHKKKIKLAFGGGTNDFLTEYLKIKQKRISDLPNTIEDPNTAIADNNIKLASAQETANNNGLTQTLDVLGNLGIQVGGALMSKGVQAGEGANGKGLTGFLNKNQEGFSSLMALLGGASQMAYGGTTGNSVEVEGKETFETPGGQVGKFKGPSHEAGGIDVNLPAGTEVYSKRIKIDGVTLADRKAKRAKKTLTLEELLEADKSDLLVRNSLDRTKVNNKKEEDLDTSIQDVVGQVMNPPAEKLAYGTGGPVDLMAILMQQMGIGTGEREAGIENVNITVPKRSLPQNPAGLIAPTVSTPDFGSIDTNASPQLPVSSGEEVPGVKKDILGDLLGNVGVGDMMSLLGDYKSAFDPMKNTLANRAGDTPNINAYENYGKDGLAVLEKSKDAITQSKEEMMKEAQLNRNATILRNRATSRGLNTQRALDLQADSQYNEMEGKIVNNASQQMANVGERSS